MRLGSLTIALLLLLPATLLSQASGPEDISPLTVGADSPNPNIRDLSGRTIPLKEVLNGKPSLVIFFRGGWCPYCNLHLAELQKIEKGLVKMGVSVIAISPDKPELLKPNIDKNKLSYSLYSDSMAQAAKDFGIAFKLDDEEYNKLKSFGHDIEQASGEDHRILPVPGAFLIDGSGNIRYSYANPDYKIRVDPGRLLQEAKALNN